MDHDKISNILAEEKLFEELPLGEGHVDFNSYFKALADIGYTRYLTIEREVGDNPEEDIRKAIRLIQAYR